MEKGNDPTFSDKRVPQTRSTTALAASAAVSGILVTFAAIVSLVMLLSHVYLFGNPTMMDQWQEMLLQKQRILFAEAISVVLVASGTTNLVGSYMLHREPKAEKWGYLILMGSVTAMFWIGGFLVGPVLGIIAGSIAVYRGRKS